MKRLSSLFLCLIMASFMILPCSIVNASTLTVSVSTAQSIGRLTTSSITGSLKLDGAPLTDGLVGIQVMSSATNILFLRTVNTGADPQNPYVDIQTVYPSDSEGNPKDNFVKGNLAYFTITAVNNDVTSHNVMIAISIFDNNNCPIGFAASASVMPQGSRTATLSVPIPSWADSGRAVVFVSAYSELPSLNGVPYCNEKSAVFTINGEEGSNPPTASSGNQGQYSLNFRLPAKEVLSTHTLHVSSSHNGVSTYSSTSFTVYQPADFNGDGEVNIRDSVSFVHAYWDYHAGRGLDSAADFNGDGMINIRDITAYIIFYVGNHVS